MKPERVNSAVVPVAGIESCIHLLRGQKVMLDADLARLYGVTTKALNQAVRRNRERFPPDFLLQLSVKDAASLRSQTVTSSDHGGRRYPPFAFTQEGIAILSSVLRSPRAVRMNIEIMRAFVRLRSFLSSQDELARKLTELEAKYESHDQTIQEIFQAIKQLMLPARAPKREIGFQTQMTSSPPSRHARKRRP